MTWDDFPVTLGQVVSVDTDAGLAMVEVAGSTVPAWLPDHLWLGTTSGPAVSAGVTVTLLRMIGGYQVVSAYTGTEGGGAPTLGPDLLANGNFESGAAGSLPDGWTALWAWAGGAPPPVSLTDDTPLEGLLSARIRMLPEWDYGSIVFYRSLPFRCDPGLTYNLSGFVQATTVIGTPTVGLEVITAATTEASQYFASGDRLVQTAVSEVSPGAAWHALAGDLNVPAGHTYMRVGVRVTATAGTNTTLRLDSLRLRQRLA